jgi:hypothetical protein
LPAYKYVKVEIADRDERQVMREIVKCDEPAVSGHS